MTHAKVWQQYTACRHQDSNRLRGSSAGGRKETSLNWRNSLDLWPFPDSSLVGNPLCDSPSPRSQSQTSLCLWHNPPLQEIRTMFWAEVNSSLLMKMEAVFRDTGKGMLRRPNKTGQIKGLKSHRASKGNRQQANGTSDFQKSTPGGHSKWQWIQTMTKKAIPLPRGNCGAILLGKGTRLFPHSLAALSKGLSVKQLDRRPLHQHQPFQTHEEHLREAAQQRQLLAAKATAYTKTYTLSGTEGVSLFSICTHAVQEPEHTVSR